MRRPVLCLLALLCCTPATSTPAPVAPGPPVPARFSGEDALARLAALMAYDRGLGRPGRNASIDHLEQSLEATGATVHRVAHEAPDPGTGEVFALVNLVAHLRPEAPRRFVIATHFDTRPWADEEDDRDAWTQPVPGANDGTSGLAVVLELLPIFDRELPPEVGITVILFDGEELGRADAGGYCMGSRHVATRIDAGVLPLVACAEFGIVLDMVGDADLRITTEPNSLGYHPRLVERVWSTAARLGYDAFDPTPRSVAVIDDHKFLTAAGIPSILLIDRDYDAWHTRRDTIDRVSAASLEAVGETVRAAVHGYWEDPPAAPTDRACAGGSARPRRHL